MIALNLILMTAVVVGVVSLLGRAVVSDRRSHRAAGAGLSTAGTPLHRNLVMPHELRVHRSVRTHTVRPRQSSMA